MSTTPSLTDQLSEIRTAANDYRSRVDRLVADYEKSSADRATCLGAVYAIASSAEQTRDKLWQLQRQAEARPSRILVRGAQRHKRLAKRSIVHLARRILGTRGMALRRTILQRIG